MPIVATFKWTEKDDVVKKIASYFPDLERESFIDLLIHYGMCPPSGMFAKEMENMLKRQSLWKKVKQKYEHLKEAWNGPDVPVLLLPSNPKNRKMQHEFHGRAGVAFTDKVFVFLTENTADDEVLSVLTHEYHHVCRLKASSKTDKDITLLDAMIMEGLAEHAVKEYCGEQYMAPWTAYYTKDEALKLWNRYLKPYTDINSTQRKYNDLLYGQKWYPPMLGYNVGYHLVASCIHHLSPSTKSTKKLLRMNSDTILQKSKFLL
ncbi:hypothetical protein FZC66_15635 [Priestia megaterium]|nr:hypothetical protein FZC66_15635 [Priestia megaterium]